MNIEKKEPKCKEIVSYESRTAWHIPCKSFIETTGAQKDYKWPSVWELGKLTMEADPY